MSGIADDRVGEGLAERFDHVQVSFFRWRRVRGHAVQQRKIIMEPTDRFVRDPDVGQRLHAGRYDQGHIGLGRFFQQQDVAGLARSDFHERNFETDEKI